ncbi:winged helix-turn-helix domain-containing protein [Actinoalloteichus hymeniacidonis]|nr:crosslink repair DNA glycosylase YcaQ family protein [Actinoalloteichus hymeniacidonis]
MRVVQTVTADAARRTALAAQGFTDRRPNGEPTRRHLKRVLERVRLLQLDSVNVAVRAHYMPVFSRLGPYSRELLDAAAWSHSAARPRLLVEQWAHEASLLPPEDWPLLRWRMRRYAERYGAHQEVVDQRSPGLSAEILAAVAELGPISAGELERAMGATGTAAKGGWWNRSDTKNTCEYLFGIGALTTGTRRGFERRYDLPERVLPAAVLATPEPEPADAARELIVRSAEALGVATEPDLRDYYRLPPKASQRAVAEAVESGALEEVAVRGWTRPAYRHPEARTPRTVTGRALLCPFDPLVWRRERAERIFDFHYRIEIYVPEPKRVFGYYVFPFLLDGRLVARVDLKADRQAGVLRAQGAFAEDGVEVPRVAAELAESLREMADWLGLDGVQLGGRGDLIGPLADCLRPVRRSVNPTPSIETITAVSETTGAPTPTAGAIPGRPTG